MIPPCKRSNNKEKEKLKGGGAESTPSRHLQLSGQSQKDVRPLLQYGSWGSRGGLPRPHTATPITTPIAPPTAHIPAPPAATPTATPSHAHRPAENQPARSRVAFRLTAICHRTAARLPLSSRSSLALKYSLDHTHTHTHAHLNHPWRANTDTFYRLYRCYFRDNICLLLRLVSSGNRGNCSDNSFTSLCAQPDFFSPEVLHQF